MSNNEYQDQVTWWEIQVLVKGFWVTTLQFDTPEDAEGVLELAGSMILPHRIKRVSGLPE